MITHLDIQDAANRFADAILRGDRLFAHPDTIKQMSEDPASRELAEKFEPSQYMEPGQLISISPIALIPESDEIPLTTSPRATNGRV